MKGLTMHPAAVNARATSVASAGRCVQHLAVSPTACKRRFAGNEVQFACIMLLWQWQLTMFSTLCGGATDSSSHAGGTEDFALAGSLQKQGLMEQVGTARTREECGVAGRLSGHVVCSACCSVCLVLLGSSYSHMAVLSPFGLDSTCTRGNSFTCDSALRDCSSASSARVRPSRPYR